MVLSVPDGANGYAYMIQMLDTSIETLSYVSMLTTGNKAHTVVVVGPEYQGLITCRPDRRGDHDQGPFRGHNGRTAVLDPDDLAPLHDIQDGFLLRPLSEFLGTEPLVDPPELAFMDWDDAKASGIGAFDYINMVLAWNTPSIEEIILMARFARIGVIPGERFTTDSMDDNMVAAIEAGVADAVAEISAHAKASTKLVNGWSWALEDMCRSDL